MKTLLKSIIGGTSLALMIGAALAQTSSGSSSSGSSSLSGSSQTSVAVQNQQQFFQDKSILGDKVKNAQDQSLGTIKDLIFKPQNGQIFAAIDDSGSPYAFIPWQTLT